MPTPHPPVTPARWPVAPTPRFADWTPAAPAPKPAPPKAAAPPKRARA